MKYSSSFFKNAKISPTFILVGGTQGLGHGLHEEIKKMSPLSPLLLLSRSPMPRGNSDIEVTAQCDLRNPMEVENASSKITSFLAQHETSSSFHFIFNSGMIEPIGNIENLNPKEIQENLSLNFVAPTLLAQSFLKSTSRMICPVTVTLVSSGVAQYPKAQWSCYSSAKAGLRAFALAIAAEKKEQKNVRFLSFSPGIMDTKMQQVIRDSSPDQFSEVQRFKDFHSQGKLLSPSLVAKGLLELIGFISENSQKEIANKVDWDISELI